MELSLVEISSSARFCGALEVFETDGRVTVFLEGDGRPGNTITVSSTLEANIRMILIKIAYTHTHK